MRPRLPQPFCSLFSVLIALVVLVMANSGANGQSNILVTPSLGFQVFFPGQESYQYSVSSSVDLTNWSAVTERQVSYGNGDVFSFGMTNADHSFYRVEQYPPDLTNRVVGLTNILFDNAIMRAQGGTLTISNFRAQSRDYSLNDYLQAQFQFDLSKQKLVLTNLQSFTNIGVVCGQQPAFFMKDATNKLILQNGATQLNPDTANTLITTGQLMTVDMKVAQAFAWRINNFTNDTRAKFFDPKGTLLIDVTTSASHANDFEAFFGGLIPGIYTMQLIPIGVASESITLNFHNCNGSLMRTLTNGAGISASLTPNYTDYAKFQVNLAANQTLQLGAPGSIGLHLDVYNSRGVLLYDWAGFGPLIYNAPTTDTYYLVLFGNDYQSHTYSSTVSITP